MSPYINSRKKDKKPDTTLTEFFKNFEKSDYSGEVQERIG
jgi:hypothetical protein